MALNKQVRGATVAAVILVLLALSFLVLRPILMSIIAGLILAYAFLPLYRKLFKLFRERNTAALAVCVIIVLIIVIPLWFLIPIIAQQTFDFFHFTQSFDVRTYVETIFPTSSENFHQEITSYIVNFVRDITESTTTFLLDSLLNIPNALLHLAVIIFVFFFTLRDSDKLSSFVSGLSPFKKDKEKILIKQFKDITSSVVFGYIVVGIIQGIATGIGLLIFGVPQALLLTVVAIFASILPMVGPWLVWIPVAAFLLINGNLFAAIGFALYSAILVSSIDNILRPYIVSKRTGVSSVIVLVGMIGGLLVFGILGIMLGPLILAYLILFLDAYKKRTLADMFHTD